MNRQRQLLSRGGGRRSPQSPGTLGRHTSAPSTLYRIPIAKPRASQIHLLTPSERTRRRNQEPQEVFRESSKEMRLVPVHHHKARVPLQVLQHQKRLKSGENVIGELATWDGQIDDRLLVRYVPARVASLYTATNAMEPKFRSVCAERYPVIIFKSQSSIVPVSSKHIRNFI